MTSEAVPSRSSVDSNITLAHLRRVSVGWGDVYEKAQFFQDASKAMSSQKKDAFHPKVGLYP